MGDVVSNSFVQKSVTVPGVCPEEDFLVASSTHAANQLDAFRQAFGVKNIDDAILLCHSELDLYEKEHKKLFQKIKIVDRQILFFANPITLTNSCWSQELYRATVQICGRIV